MRDKTIQRSSSESVPPNTRCFFFVYFSGPTIRSALEYPHCLTDFKILNYLNRILINAAIIAQ